MIPENKKTIVKKALQTAFGVDSYEDIEEITIGLSNALTFRIAVKNKTYLMKIARTDELSAPANYYEYMKAGSDAGIAPHVWYLSTEDKISITDFIEAKPFPIDKAKEIMPKLLDKLHKLPPFHKGVNYSDAMDGIVQRFFGAKFLSDNLSEEIMKNYIRIKEIYPCHSEDLVSCHNDLKPENYIFDGEKAWLVDWEAAFLNDRYLDLAVVGNFAVNNEDDELEYLENYFGEAPNDYIRARFFLMQQLLHIFYMSIFMLYSSKTVDINIEGENVSFEDFHKRMWEGEIDLANDENKLKYGIVHMNQFLANIKTERFEEALKVISKSSRGN
ncbi:phosphotransferase [Clostridium sp. YIM B02505]|uniref:Phosphotransferase n=1 Tax=Clostridium yunnanense TaxID=2800325 RepID=A0ABS1ETY4_9CLOT|nr:phosphotransferase [Clostridium yunnanense]MBK1812748.1 phosphotransferase [Clostridium yunnanense]